jgi:hypothetical protein
VGLTEHLYTDKRIEQSLCWLWIALEEEGSDRNAGHKRLLYYYCHFQFEIEEGQNLLITSEGEGEALLTVHAYVGLVKRHH